MRRREPGPAELEALDPLTGEALSRSLPPAATMTATNLRRARWLRRVATLLVVLSVACAATAAYFTVSIVQLRNVERTWRSAMALDAARAEADRQVRTLLEEVAPNDNEEVSLLPPLGAIGSEVAGGLRRHERALADGRILDSKVSVLRDAMVEALEFRRFQLSPTRNRIGDTPLQRVELTIDDQLDRWGLAPSQIDEPTLASISPALAKLRRYADVQTGATLFALDGTTLHTIDVDRSRRRKRSLPTGISDRLVPVAGGVGVVAGGRLDVYPPDPAAPPLAAIDIDVVDVIAAGDRSGDLWIVQGGGTTIRRFAVDGTGPGWKTEPAALPPGRALVGSTFDHLVLESPGNGLELWSASLTGPVTTLASQGARFLAANGSMVLFQGPLPFSPQDSTDFLHRYQVSTDRRDLIGLPRTDAASASLSTDGTAAVAAGPSAGRLGSILLLEPDAVALTGGNAVPRSSVKAGALAWAVDGRSLFWLTPDGAIAVSHGDGPGTRQLLRTGLDGLDRLVVMGR